MEKAPIVKVRVPKGKAPKKFYYFNCYGLGEPIRMALSKAKVKYTDVRPGIDKFKDLKSKGMFENGQMPMLELVDGTRLVQSNAILNYIGNTFKLVPKDPKLVYRGESIQMHFERDFQSLYLNQAIWFAGGKGQ